MRSRMSAPLIALALVSGLLVPATIPTGQPAVAAARPVAECRLESSWRQFNEGFAIDEAAADATGTLTVQAVYADFPDQRGGGDGEFWFEHLHADAAQAIANLETQSAGRLDVVIREPATWVTLPHGTSAYPESGDAAWGNRVFHEFVTDAIAAAAPTIDFAGADVVWVFYPWVAPLAARAQADNFVPLTPDGEVFRAITMPKPGSDAVVAPVIVHETGHTFGFPDLYDAVAPGGGSPFLGSWDPMSDGWGDGAALESWEFMGWHLWRLGWIDDDQVTCVDPSTPIDVTLDALTQRGGSVIAVVPAGEHRALVIESRKAERYDAAIPRPGVLVTVVDSEVGTGEGPVRVAPRDGTAFPVTTEEFANATLLPGERYTDPGTGVTVTVLESTGGSDLVRIAGPDATPQPQGTSAAEPAAEPADAVAILPPTGSEPRAAFLTAMVLLLAGGAAWSATRTRRALVTRRSGSD